MRPEILSTMIVASICILLGLLSYKKGVLDLYGSLAAAVMGLVVGYSAGLAWLLLLILFVLLGYGSTRYRYSFKAHIHVGEENWGRRNTVNVLANGMIPSMFSVLWFVPWFPRDLAAMAFVASVASITADTLSSELGVLSRGYPRLITTLEKVPPGTDGGISPMGEAAGLAGITIIVLAASGVGILPLRTALFVGFFGGFAGSHFDSLMGDMLERKGYIGNAAVNFSATLVAALVGILGSYVLV